MSDNLGTAHGVLKLDADVAALIKSMGRASDSTKQAETKIDQSTQKIEQHYSELANQVSKSADKVVAANKKVEESEKKLDSRRRKSTNAAIKRTQAVGKRDIEVEQEKQVGRRQEAIDRMLLQSQKSSDSLRLAELRSNLSRRNSVYKTANAELSKDMSRVDTVIRRSLLAPAEMQQKIQAAIASPYRQAQRFAMRGPNVTASMALNQQLAAAVGAQNAAFLVGGGRRPTALGGTAAGGAGGGGGLGIFGRLLGAGGGGLAGGLVSGLASGLGIGVGGYALAQGGRALVESTETATAYARQTVAARNLAGSQAELNQLLAAYADASGNAVDKVTSLSNVTRLMATGFANTAPELEKFVRATRGASIALGKPQDYVIQETQLAISNTSVKRLDQIGLGITEVNDRIEVLRKTNAGWNREMAFQDAVISLLDEKYGKLTKTAEGQATGVEKLKKSWSDLRLSMGQAAKGPVDAGSMLLSVTLDNERKRLDEFVKIWQDKADSDIRIMRRFGIRQPGIYTSSDRAMMGANWTDDSRPAPIVKAKGRREDQQEVIDDFYQRFADLEKNYAEQRLNTIQQYEEQRNALVRNYGKMMVREEEDFQRQRARALEDYEFAILEVMRDAQEREAEMQEDLDKRIADLKENGNEKIDEIEEKYQKSREKSFADHRDRLLKAAGQLDAIAVLEERKRWKRENEEAQEGRDEAVKEVREDLNKQIEEAREAHAERLEDARKADEDRLRDMAVAREKQLARENEDRAIRLERAKEDHEEQLAELDRQHQLRLSQIATQQAEERAALQTAFEEALQEVGVYVKGLTAKQNERLKLVDEWFEYMVGKMENMLLVQRDPERYKFNPETGPQIPLDYGSSLRVNTAGTATMQTSNSSKTLTVNEGAFQIFTAPGEAYTAGLSVEEYLVKLLEGF